MPLSTYLQTMSRIFPPSGWICCNPRPAVGSWQSSSRSATLHCGNQSNLQPHATQKQRWLIYLAWCPTNEGRNPILLILLCCHQWILLKKSCWNVLCSSILRIPDPYSHFLCLFCLIFTLIVDADVAIFAGSCKMLSTFGKITAMQRVLFFLDWKKFLHGRHVEIVKKSSPEISTRNTHWSLQVPSIWCWPWVSIFIIQKLLNTSNRFFVGIFHCFNDFF